MSVSRRTIEYFFLLILLLLLISFSLFLIFGGGNFGISGERVEVIYVQGVMLTGSVPAGLGIATSEDVSRSLKEASQDGGVKAIVMRVNSPGGSPAAAEEILSAMRKIDKPIVISMGDVAASGAYYISAPADRIIANPDTITGSIGIIWEFKNRSEFYEKDGTAFYISKSGGMKDMGGDWRGLTDEEKRYADQIIAESYSRFVDEVASGRNLTRSRVKDLADGRLYTGAKARELGLVDELGSLEDAIDVAAKLGGIEGRPEVTYANRPSLSQLIFGGEKIEISAFTRYFEDSKYGKLLSIY